MSLETLPPDSILTATNYSVLNLTDINEDPGTPDGVFGTWRGNGNTVATVSFPTPTGELRIGAGKQTFRVQIRKSAVTPAITNWA